MASRRWVVRVTDRKARLSAIALGGEKARPLMYGGNGVCRVGNLGMRLVSL